MSFQTRSGRIAARGQQQTQVTYHQSPRQQYAAPSFVPAATPTQPAPPGAVPQTQQSPQQFKMQQPSVMLEQVKTEAPAPVATQASAGMVVNPAHAASPAQTLAQSSEGHEQAETQKPWQKKKPTFKINKVQKRRRQNARFRKLLIPKNAIMVLNELQPGITFDSDEQMNAFNQLTYSVKVEIDGVTYTGEGPSKATAKAAAAELAVKGLILKKISDASTKKEKDGGNGNGGEDDQMDTASGDDMSEKGSTNGKRVIPEDEVPWGSLASFALFKLFADWKAQGTNIPSVVPPSILKPIPKATPKAAPAKGSMPENPETVHPVTLVGRLYPGTLFSELSREGTPPNLTFCMGATVNGVQYTGTAQNKKEAKKNCALNILKAMNVPYGAA